MRHAYVLAAIVVYLLASTVVDSAILAAEPPGTEPVASKPDDAARTLVFFVKHSSANEVADALSRLFDDNWLQVVPEPKSGCLLIRVVPEVRDDVVAILAELDRPPRAITLQLMLLRTPAGRKPDAAGRSHASELRGKTDVVEGKVRELEASGELLVVNHVQLTTLENQQALVQVGQRKAAAVGGQMVRPGVRTTSYS